MAAALARPSNATKSLTKEGKAARKDIEFELIDAVFKTSHLFIISYHVMQSGFFVIVALESVAHISQRATFY